MHTLISECGFEFDAVRSDVLGLLFAAVDSNEVGAHQIQLEQPMLYLRMQCHGRLVEKPEGELNFFLGLQIKQTTEGILVNQAKYAKELIKKFGMEGSKPMSTPMSTSTKLDKDENGKPVNEKMYRGPSEPQPDFNMQLFTNRVNEGNWAGFKSRPIISGRQVSISPRYHRYINDVIAAAGWTEILTVSNIIYPKLVRYFYCNLDVDRNADEYTLVSRVKGVDFVLDVSTMSSFLQCLAVERNQYVTNDDELNNHKALPYGALLIKLFLSAKVRIQGEQTLQNDPGPIKDYTFTRGHINDDEEGNPQVNNAHGQEDIAGQQGEHLAQPHIGDDFTTQIFARFDALQTSQNQLLAEFQNFAIAQNSRFDRVEHRMDHIDQAQQHYFSHFHRQYPDFVPYPPYHPPSPPQ
ncbi:hypothetical protein RHSIM_Rhsim06G0164800 [Rhododendron simsii]|uniref:Reverse transcriptase Ty1/copia-type domain-containing protein n=1 Tax=Rhododendron simsii TaxID=118357 RepID=A0A834GQK0_RHOSS|nr:hypothetical protein RHSIM_Rhsim06G0164800 [Rhododendron simsii]